MAQVLLPSPQHEQSPWFGQLHCRSERMHRRRSTLLALLRQKTPRRQCNEHILEKRAKTEPTKNAKVKVNGHVIKSMHDDVYDVSWTGRNNKHGKKNHSLQPRNLNGRFESVMKPMCISKAQSNTACDNVISDSVISDATVPQVTTAIPKKSKQLGGTRSSNTNGWDSPLKQSFFNLYSQQPPRKCRSQVISGESSVMDEVFENEDTLHRHRAEDSDSDDEIQFMDHSHRSRKRSHLAQGSTSSDDYDLHATDIMYYVPGETKLPSGEISPPRKNPEDVRVPTFRVKPVPAGYQMERTENLTDEAFLKRHQKPEGDEKRRKRWDAQMLRERKMFEHLQKRAAQVNTPKNGTTGTAEKSQLDNIISFLPEPDNVRYLKISEDVPVSIFGYTVPKLKPTEFYLPWFGAQRLDNHDTEDQSQLFSLGNGF